MNKPVIGVMPLVDFRKESLWMLPGYMEVIEMVGGVPIMLPLSNDDEVVEGIAGLCDGFLFTGGHDVNPSLYGEETLPVCGEISRLRDSMERKIFARAAELDLPALGICRGIQLFNVLCGGTLYQDLPTQKPSDIEHRQSPPYDKPVHEVRIIPDTPLYKLLGTQQLWVNSYHHQAIKRLAPSLCPMAVSPDGLVEAVYMPGKRYIRAVQWHPEFCYRTSRENLMIAGSLCGRQRIRRLSPDPETKKRTVVKNKGAPVLINLCLLLSF